MPFLGREKGRGQKSRRSDDEFVVFLQGIPTHCRWQELKDLVRQTALHIRQAVVYDDSHGFPTGLGQIIVKNEDEAWRTYQRLSTNGWEGQSLVVTLARTSAPTKPIAGPTRSPPAMIHSYISGHSTPTRSHGNVAMPPSPVSSESIHSRSSAFYSDYVPLMVPMPVSSQQFMMDPTHCFPPSPLLHYDAPPGWGMMPFPVSPSQPRHDYTDSHMHYEPRKPWSHSDTNIPIFGMAHREVHIQNLTTATTATDLRNLLQGVGIVEQCSVSPTSDISAQALGYAIMHSAEDAKRAVTMLNNMMFMGAHIRVKINARPGFKRGTSYETVSQEEIDLPDLVSCDRGSEYGEYGQDVSLKKAVEPRQPNQPLVVDGSGVRSRSEILSVSAPT